MNIKDEIIAASDESCREGNRILNILFSKDWGSCCNTADNRKLDDIEIFTNRSPAISLKACLS